MNHKNIKMGMKVKIINNDFDVGFKIGTIGEVTSKPIKSDTGYTFDVTANGHTWSLNHKQISVAEHHCPECNLTLTSENDKCPFHNKKGRLK
jgi:hypothetical protein